jgi:hypothetical protein
MADDLAQLAYEAALRRLERQEELLTEAEVTNRTSAGRLLARRIRSRPAGDRRRASRVRSARGAAFATAMGASLFVLMPKRDLVFALVGPRVHEELYDLRDDMPEVYRRLAYDLDRFWDLNDRVLQRFSLQFESRCGRSCSKLSPCSPG